MAELTTTDKFTMAHNVLNQVDMLLVEVGFAQDSSVRHNLKIAKSMFREAESRNEATISELRDALMLAIVNKEKAEWSLINFRDNSMRPDSHYRHTKERA